MRQEILDRLQVLAATAADGEVLAGRFDPPALPIGQASVVIRAEDATGAPDRATTGILAPVWILVPLASETPGGYRAAYRSAAAEAESTILALENAILADTGHTWQAAWRASRIEQRLSRPQPHLLCAEAMAVFGFSMQGM